ncbi:anchored repeat ABC transporter, substrate-binding protein [Cellulomonas triticagri]|uniref:anchored repeat ABC transporter, substrate-binding protein n=1 Tax=Cellulomonas triticagri TaxID=2483352 RepID=UPI001F43B052|nr:anchored repeat ABC transporter, substrate-binding protein [Cellulomonas triticagri]
MRIVSRRARRRTAALGPVVLATLGLALAGCAGTAGTPDDRLQVVTTTPVLADLARQVAGDRARVTSIVPDRGDPHSYEPSLRDVRDVVYADVAFSNYMLLEEHAIIRTLDANLRPGVPNVSLAESAVKYAAEVIPLVENVNLDTVWLGLRVAGSGAEHGATRASQVEITATRVDGPGQLTAYLTETFGSPRVYVDSQDGVGTSADSVTLPAEAHSHMSWTFSEPGVYRLGLAARLAVTDDADPVDVGSGTFTFVVGVDPHAVAGQAGAAVLDAGHADLTVDLDSGELVVVADEAPGGAAHDHAHDGDPGSGQRTYAADEVVIAVPGKALAPVPAGQGFGFLGRGDEQIYQLPQAVLGKHVHGEIDPHLWLDVRNARAYVEIMRDTLVSADPAGAADYRANAEAYLDVLARTDAYVTERIASIPQSRRYLVTTHDAFAYLGRAYGLTVAGFVTPNPAVEPSLADRRKLAETIDALEVPAVFLEPALAGRSSVLAEVAADAGVQVCPIYSDSFGPDVGSYVELMRFDADSLARCLG